MSSDIALIAADLPANVLPGTETNFEALLHAVAQNPDTPEKRRLLADTGRLVVDAGIAQFVIDETSLDGDIPGFQYDRVVAAIREAEAEAVQGVVGAETRIVSLQALLSYHTKQQLHR